MSKDASFSPPLGDQQALTSGTKTNKQSAHHSVVARGPKLLRYQDIKTLKDDLIVRVGPIAYFFRGEDTTQARRAIYYQYERGNLPGAVEYGSSVAVSKSLALAAMWAESTKNLDARTVQLMELHLQLSELANALSECGSDQSDIAKLSALLDATRKAVSAALVTPSPRLK